jgi:hypothetical protein
MPKKKYIVTLTSEEREQLERLVTTGKSAAYKVNHARILLKADTHQADGSWTDQQISEALDISVSTIERVRQRSVEQSLDAALSRQVSHPSRLRLLDGECRDLPPLPKPLLIVRRKSFKLPAMNKNSFSCLVTK